MKNKILKLCILLGIAILFVGFVGGVDYTERCTTTGTVWALALGFPCLVYCVFLID